MYKLPTEIKALFIVVMLVLYFIIEDNLQSIFIFSTAAIFLLVWDVFIPYISIIRNKNIKKLKAQVFEAEIIEEGTDQEESFLTIKFTYDDVDYTHSLYAQTRRKPSEKVTILFNPNKPEEVYFEDEMSMSIVQGILGTFICIALISYHIYKFYGHK